MRNAKKLETNRDAESQQQNEEEEEETEKDKDALAPLDPNLFQKMVANVFGGVVGQVAAESTTVKEVGGIGKLKLKKWIL